MTKWLKIQVEDGKLVKQVKLYLESINLLNKDRKIDRDGTLFNIYTRESEILKLEHLIASIENLKVAFYEDSREEVSLHSITLSYLHKNTKLDNISINKLLEKLPKKWSIYPPLILFGFNSYDDKEWEKAFSSNIDQKDYFGTVLSSGLFPLVSHFAINKPIIEEDVMRRPFNLNPLFGDFGPSPSEALFSNPLRNDLDEAFWCSVKQNGIFQTWAPRYTMFSRGNIKEKKRILDNFQDLDDSVVVDLYAGIGYFTLSYLNNHARVFCWELNPWSIEGLIRGASKAKYKYTLITRETEFDEEYYQKCLQEGVQLFIFHESNEFAPIRLSKLNRRLPISHINLGLLPSSFDSWGITNLLIDNFSDKSVIVHVHENVHVDEFENMKEKVLNNFNHSHFLSLEKIKTFAPDVWHIVIDILINKD